jgi:hypothetical protein
LCMQRYGGEQEKEEAYLFHRMFRQRLVFLFFV